MTRFLIGLQVVLVLALLVSSDDGNGDPRRDAHVAAYAAEHGIPQSFVEAGGRTFLLVPPSSFPWHAPSGDRHMVWMRLPYYVQAAPTAAGATWHEARALGERITRANEDHRFRMPTEAEWALARRLHPPTAVPALASWCADWFGPHPEQDLSDPVGPRSGTQRVVRGPGPERRGLAPETSSAGVGVRLVAELGWRGDRPVHLRTVVRDRAGAIVRAEPGYRVRLIRILDRLADRQAGRRAEWTDVPGTTPMTLHMFPGRYYVVAVKQMPDGALAEGREHKLLVGAGARRIDLDVP